MSPSGPGPGVPGEVLESLGVERNNKWLFRQADGTILERWFSVNFGVAPLASQPERRGA